MQFRRPLLTGLAAALFQFVGPIVAAPTLLISNAVLFEGNAGTTNAIFDVTLTEPSTDTVTVTFATANDTASANTDYLSTNGAISFPPGITLQHVTIVVHGDTVEEPTETFLVLLSQAVNATIADATGVGTIRNDEGAAGKLDHFTWEAISSPKTVDEPFETALTARDVFGDPVLNFAGAVELSAHSGAHRPSPIVISELDPGPTDQVEFINVSGQPVDLSRWQIVLYDGTTWPAPRVVFNVPNQTSVPIGGIFTIRESNIPSAYPNFTIPAVAWNDTQPITRPVAVLLLNATGQVVDFFAAGDADPARITSPALITPLDWNGPTVPASTVPTRSYQRTGDLNNHRAEDWTSATRSMTRLNSGMSATFRDQSLALTPLVVSQFTDGTWRGAVTLTEYGASAVLSADDGNGHSGQSNPFELTVRNDLRISLTEAPINAQVFRPFFFTLSVTNPGPAESTSVVLSNSFPAGTSVLQITPSQGVASWNDASVLVNLGTIPAEGFATVRYTLLSSNVGSFSTHAIVTRAEPDQVMENNAITVSTLVQGECAGLPPELISWWAGDGNSDDRIGNRHATLENGATFASGMVGQAFSFDGVDDMVLVPDDPSLSIAAGVDFSIEAWIKIPAGTPNALMSIFDKRISADSPTATGVMLWIANGRLAALMGDSTAAPSQFTSWQSTSPDLRDGNWHHIALSVQRSTPQGGKLYVDGAAVLTFNPTPELGDLSVAAPVRIGHGANPAEPAPFKGSIDELSFYRRALTSGDITSIVQAGSLGKCVDDLYVTSRTTASELIFKGETVSYFVEIVNPAGAPATGVRVTNLLPQGARLVEATVSQGTVTVESGALTGDLGTINSGQTALLTVTAAFEQDGTLVTSSSISRQESDANLGNNHSHLTFTVIPECASLPDDSTLWPGDGSGADLSGRSIGNLLNGVTFTEGKVGQAFAFDGLNDFISVPHSPELNAGPGQDYSIEAWIRVPPTSRKEALTIVDKRQAFADTGAGVVGYWMILYNGVLTVGMADAPLNSTANSFFSPGPDLRDNLYHHVAATFDRDSASGGRLYVDGNLVHTFNPTVQPGDLSNDSPFLIGFNAHGSIDSYFDGAIDEVVFHRRALSPEQIRLTYLLGARGYCAPAGAAENDLAVSATIAPTPLQINQPGTYSVTVTNLGPAAATNVVLSNNLPAGVTIVSAVPTQGAAVQTAQGVLLTIDSLPSQTSATLTITFASSVTGIVGWSSTVTRDGLELNLRNNRVSESVEITTACVQAPLDAVAWWRAESLPTDSVSGLQAIFENGGTYAAGRVGKGFSFDGIDDVVTVPSNPVLQFGPGQDFSIEGWIQVQGTTTDPNLVIFDNRTVYDASSSVGVVLFLSFGGLSTALVDNSGNAGLATVISSGPDLRDGKFHHVALVVERHSETGGKFYVDGAPAGTFNPTSEAGDLSHPGPIRIGRANSTIAPGPFKGVIDELSVYRRALGPGEIRAIVDAGATGKCADGIALSVTPTPNQAVAGDPVTLRYQMSNIGTGTMTGIRFTATVPAPSELLSITSTHGIAARDGNKGTVIFDSLPAGEVATLSLTLLPKEPGHLSVDGSVFQQVGEESLLLREIDFSLSVQVACVPLQLDGFLWSAEGESYDQQGLNAGTMLNGVTYASGMVGRAFSFDGVDDMITIPSVSALNFGPGADLSMEAWIRLPTGAAKEAFTIFDKRNAPAVLDGSALGYWFIVFNGRLAGGLADAPLAPGQSSSYFAGGPDLRDNRFHHVAMTVDRDSATGGKFYVDGVEVGTFNPTGEPGNLANDKPLILGQNAHGSFDSYFKGEIDEAALHRRALAADEVRAIFQAGVRGYCPGGLLDRDQDTLPDAWEIQHGLSRFDSSDAALDLDGDGSSNLSEYRAATNPRDKSSVLHIMILGINNTHILLALNTITTRSYQIERSSLLTENDWVPVGPVIVGTGEQIEAMLELNGAAAQNFYRVRLTTP